MNKKLFNGRGEEGKNKKKVEKDEQEHFSMDMERRRKNEKKVDNDEQDHCSMGVERRGKIRRK